MILIKDKDHDVPFVREVLVESLTRAGMKPWQAHSFTKSIEDELLGKGTETIEREDFFDLVYERLREVNEKVSERYKAWRELRKGDREPLILLIGGGTGVGTTTVGTEVAYRLGIRNIMSTDSIREVMRKTVSEKLLPELHSSSYDAHKSMNAPLVSEKDAPLTGFRVQTIEVGVGIEAIIERALKEGIPTLIEGLHAVPGYISEDLIKKKNVMMFILHMKDEKEHKNRLYSRAFETKFRRSVDGYMENFKSIREIQKHIKKQAEDNKIPIIENNGLEDSIVEIMDTVIDNIVKQNQEESE
jgi:2-phosphoglycerate kinase